MYITQNTSHSSFMNLWSVHYICVRYYSPWDTAVTKAEGFHPSERTVSYGILLTTTPRQ